jgi:hypothetical protein
MNKNEPAQPDPKIVIRIDDEAKRLYIDCMYSGRGHQVAGHRWSSVHFWLGSPAAVLSAVLGIGAAGSALLGNAVIAAILAISAVVFTSLNEFLKPKEQAEAHLAKGSQYIGIRNKVRLLREVEIPSGLSLEEMKNRLIDLRGQYDVLGLEPPRNIPRWAYEKAKKNIASGESGYENDPLWKELSKK